MPSVASSRAYDTARSIFRTAIALGAGAFILEIARSEIAYTDQRPAEYVSVILGAALREGFRGPLFIQGDHFQINHKKFAVDPVTEVNAVKALVKFLLLDRESMPLSDLRRLADTASILRDAAAQLGVECLPALSTAVDELVAQGLARLADGWVYDATP